MKALLLCLILAFVCGCKGSFMRDAATAADTLFTRIANDQTGYCPPLYGCPVGSLVQFIEADPLARKAVRTNWGAARGWLEGNAMGNVVGRGLDRIPFLRRCQCVAVGLHLGGSLEGANAFRESWAAVGVLLRR